MHEKEARILNQSPALLRSGSAIAVPRRLALCLVLALGAVLRLATLSRQSLWLDEGLSYWYANRPWVDLFIDQFDTSIRPLYLLFLQPMIRLGGSEWLLRLPSALAGIASIGVFYSLGKELFDRRTGLLAALLLAISPFHIWYSQEARFYALVAFFSLAAVLFAARALRTNRFPDWFLFGVFEGLALITETAAVWLVLAINAAALILLRDLWRSRRLFPWVASQLLALAIYLPVLPNFLGAAISGGPAWIPPATLRRLMITIVDFTGGYMRPRLEMLLVLLFYSGGLLFGAKWLLQDARSRPDRYILLFCLLVLPVGVNFLISQNYFKLPLLSLVFPPGHSTFLSRNLIVASFPLYLLLARSYRYAKGPVAIGILVALIALNGMAYLANHLTERKEDYRSAAKIVMDRASAGDVILFAPPSIEAPFAYYYQDRLQYQGNSQEGFRDGVISEDQKQPYASPVELLEKYSRVWLITTSNIHQQDTSGIGASLEENGQLLGKWQVKDVTVQLFEQKISINDQDRIE